MKSKSSTFYALRVYKTLTKSEIFNSLLCNRLMRSPRLVAKSPQLFKNTTRILGSRIPSFVLNKTFCKLFTAGNNIKQATEIANHYRKQNISVVLDYCVEGHIGCKENEINLDSNAEYFAQSGRSLLQHHNDMFSIKITGLIDMHLLKKINDATLNISSFWKENSKDGKMYGEQMFNGLAKIWGGISQELFRQYLKVIHNYNGQPSQFYIDEIQFKMNHHAFYLQTGKNQNTVIRLFMPMNSQQISQSNNFIRRLAEICDPISNNQKNIRILVDAEQSYVQRAIESISQQLQAKYNQQKLFIMPTIQSYLKTSVNRMKYEVEIAKRRKLVFGAKIVRGAYIVEETRVAKQNNLQFPIVENFQKTTQNYMNNLECVLKNIQNGEVIVASHNQQTIFLAQNLREKYPNCPKLSFAQLLGLADHLTWQLKQKGQRVYKLLPYAKTQVMVPYMIRRAEQLQQMRYPLDIQNDLLIHELKSRYLN